MSKTEIIKNIGRNKERLENIAQTLWENPEISLQEERSAGLLSECLEEEGFRVERTIGGMPTAFVAAYGEGHPKIGILGEYDALPGLSQKTKAQPEPIEEGTPGHGCGHNLFGTAGIGAAIAVKDRLDTGDIDGTVVFYGCPAEETLVGKTYMAREGVFNDLDGAVTWHPGYLSTPRQGATNALNSLQFTFEGTSSHAGISPEAGRSALDAVELLNTGVEYMREHTSDDARLHYTITEGGGAPNVVPANASVWYFVRAPTRGEVEQNTDWLRDIADGAAQMTQTSVEERFLTGCYDYRANEVITDTIWKNMQAIGDIEYSEEDFNFANKLQETLSEETVEMQLLDLPERLRRKIEEKPLYPKPVKTFDQETQSHGSTEVGDVSWITPTGQFRGASWPVGTPNHTWQAVAANGSFGQHSVPFAAKVLAGTVYDLMSSTDKVEEARNEFEMMLDGRSYETPLPEGVQPPFDMPI